MKTLRVLSLGAGVQSTTLALMIEKGEIPMVDAAIFADTGAEPKEVYTHLEWLKKQLSYPVHIVQWRNLKDDVLSASIGEYKQFTAPFFSKDIETGKKGMLRRQCTGQYKIKPVVKKIRELMGYKKGEKVNKKEWKVEQLIGISTDEMQRMKENPLKYITNQYPLIEKDITRLQCLEWIKNNNYPEPPRSACTFCPYHSNEEWSKIKQNKEEWEEVVMIDFAIRNTDKYKENNKKNNLMYLHSDCIPINQIDFGKDDGQFSFSFDDECEGMCGN
jgi:3'-phosphoadenosine 5'-phosphosulfate sulfotransferase (PAPS reductase)/FAD synthetase